MMKQQKQVRQFMLANNQVAPSVPTALDSETLLLRIRLMREELLELEDALWLEPFNNIAKELCDLLYVVIGTAVSLGLDVEPLFDAVHENNLSKSGHQIDGKVTKQGAPEVDLAPLIREQLCND